ncbi:MAG: hypothetical protein WCL30_02500 [Pseudomonadota bacterium]
MDDKNEVVFRVNDDGSMESHLVTADIIQDWISEGNTPLPAATES